MNREDRFYAWNEGMPTGPDVTALQKRWPSLNIGDRIPYAEVEEVLGLEWKSSRFKTVTEAWRRRELEAGRVINCERGIGFAVATSEQITSDTYPVLQQVGRKVRKQRHKLTTIKPATDTEKQVIEHHGRILNAIERDAKKARMNMLPESVPAQTRISPPKMGAA